MPVFIALTTVVGLLGVVNLLLMFGVLRRLREHTELLNTTALGSPSLREGEPVGDFAATTVDGEPVGNEGPAAEKILVGLFTPHCGSCKKDLPTFITYARSASNHGEKVLAVAVGDDGDDGDEMAELVSELRQIAHVVRESRQGPIGTALRVRAYPVILRLARRDDGTLAVAHVVNLEREALRAL